MKTITSINYSKMRFSFCTLPSSVVQPAGWHRSRGVFSPSGCRCWAPTGANKPSHWPCRGPLPRRTWGSSSWDTCPSVLQARSASPSSPRTNSCGRSGSSWTSPSASRAWLTESDWVIWWWWCVYVQCTRGFSLALPTAASSAEARRPPYGWLQDGGVRMW